MNDNTIRPGDKFRRLIANRYYGWESGDVFTCKEVSDGTTVVDTNDRRHDRCRVEKVADAQDPDVQQLVDAVTTGRIKRGGVQGKFVVYTNDVGDTIIQLFKQ